MSNSTYDDPGDLEDSRPQTSTSAMSNSTYDDPGELQDSRPQTSTSAINESCNTSIECEITSSSQSPRIHYKKRKGFSGLRGEAFEYKTIALLFARATNSKSEFCLATSKDGLGAFDDIVLKINKDSKYTNYFFQLKNKETAKITRDGLLSPKHDFSLFKLHQSYLEVESFFEKNPSDPLFNGKFSNCYYILYTNAQLESNIQPHNGDIDLDTHIIGDTNLTSVLKFNEVRHKDIIDGISHLTKFKEFFNQFIIMYNQPKNDSLDKLIEAELTKSVYLQKYDMEMASSIFRDRVLEWWQHKNYLLKESWDSFNPLRETKEYIRIIELNEIFENRKNELKKLNLTFNSRSLREIKNKIEMSNSILIFAPGRSTTITAAKLHQSLGDSSPHRFINLLNLDTYIQEIKATWPSKYSRLIIEIPKTDTEYVNVYSEIRKIFKKEMKVVFIIQNTGNLKQLNSLETEWKSILKKVHDCTTISDFETLTQESFLQKRIVFQGHEISLSELINIDDVHILKNLDIDSLSLLLANEKPTIGSELPNSPDFYIDRTLKSNLYVSSEIFNEKGIVFALFGTTFSELSYIVPTGEKLYNFNEWKDDLDYRFLYVDDSDHFNRLCMSEYRPILWLRKERDGLILKQSNGDRKLIKQYLEESYVTESMPSDIMEDENRVLLITAEPGMGKSTLFTHLTKQTQIRHPNIWVVRIDINYHSKLLHRIKSDGFTDNDAIELLSSAAGINVSPCIGLASDLFRHCYLSTGNMAVLVDGIDEVSPSYFNEVIQILIVLCKTEISKIWLTSRPFLKSKLEYALGITSYVLKPFNKEDQIKFLVEFWKSRLISNDTSLLCRIATHSLEQLSKHLNGNEIDFLGIPLQSLLLAEIIEKRLHTGVFNVVIDSRNLNLLILYDLYVDKKWQIYLQEKKNSDITNVNVILDEKDLYDIYIRNHEVAAMVSIFENEELKELQSSIFDSQWISFLNKIERGEEKTGMILRSHMGTPLFLHRTFAEYFAAKWFYNNFHSCKAFLSQRIFEPRFQVIKSIFDRLLAKDSSLHLAVLNNDLEGVRKILENDANANRQDKGGRTALHLAVTYSRIDIIKLLLNHCVDFSICDNILEMSILQYALKSENFLALSLIMENKQETQFFIKNVIDIKALKYILIICSQNGYLNVLDYIFEIKSELLTEDFRNELMVEAVRRAQIAFISRLITIRTRTDIRNTQGKTLLHISSESGQLKVIVFLLEYHQSGKLVDINQSSDGIFRYCQNQKCLNVQECEVFQRSTAKMEYLEVPDTEGNTVVHLAAKADHIHILHYLVVELGCNVKSLNKCNQSPLALAALYGRQEAVLFLLKNSCNLTKNEFLSVCNSIFQELHNDSPEKPKDESPHLLNTTKLKCQILSALIDYGLDVEWRFDDGNTLLHKACASGNLDITCLILKLKPLMINLKNKREETPLHLAVLHGRQHVVQYLLKMKANTNESDISRNTPLHIACTQGGNFEIIKNLVINNASIDLINCNMETPLYLATLSRNNDVVEYLIEKGASLICKTRTGCSLLLGSCKAGNFRMVKCLIEKGVKINDVDNNGDTCLHLAACTKNQPLIDFICDQVDNINVKNYSGETALLKAARIGNIFGVKCLLNKSADVKIIDNNYCIALDIAITNGDLELSKYLYEKGALWRQDIFFSAIKNGYVQVIQYFVENGGDLQQINERNQTMLHIACQLMDCKSVIYFTLNGIHMNIKDQSGRTALHYAVESGNFFNVHCLIKHGASVSIADFTGSIPLHIAAGRGIYNISKHLIKHNSPIDARNNLMQTPLFIAAMNGHEDICRILIQAGADIKDVKDVNGVSLWDLLKQKIKIIS